MILRQNLRCSKNKRWHRRSFALRCNRFYICCTGMFCFSCPPIWTSRRKTHRKLSSSLFLKCFFFYKTHFYNMQHGFMVLCGASSLSTNLKCGDEYPSNLYKVPLDWKRRLIGFRYILLCCNRCNGPHRVLISNSSTQSGIKWRDRRKWGSQKLQEECGKFPKTRWESVLQKKSDHTKWCVLALFLKASTV